MYAHPRDPTRSSAVVLHVLLYRYLFFDWLFRDVNHGSVLERAAARRFNREMQRYLPSYLRRWSVLVASSSLLGAWLEGGLGLKGVAAAFYLITSLAIAMSMLILRVWVGLQYE